MRRREVLVDEVVAEFARRVKRLHQLLEIGRPRIEGPQRLRRRVEYLAPVRPGAERVERVLQRGHPRNAKLRCGRC